MQNGLLSCTATGYTHSQLLRCRYRTLADVKGTGLREKLLRNCATEEHRRKITPKAVDLLSRMLCLDPDRRITARDAIMHEYFYEEPMACEPEELPKFAASHEMTMKAKRKADKEAHRGQEHNKRGRYDGHHDNRYGAWLGSRIAHVLCAQAAIPWRRAAGAPWSTRAPAGTAGPLPRSPSGRRAPQTPGAVPGPAAAGARQGRRAGGTSAGRASPGGAAWRLPARSGGVWQRLWCVRAWAARGCAVSRGTGGPARPGQSSAPFSASGGYGAPAGGVPRYGVEHKGPYRGPGGQAPQPDRRGGQGPPQGRPQWDNQRR